MNAGPQEYPPGTVGHLAAGRGWTAAADQHAVEQDPTPPVGWRSAEPVAPEGGIPEQAGPREMEPAELAYPTAVPEDVWFRPDGSAPDDGTALDDVEYREAELDDVEYREAELDDVEYREAELDDDGVVHDDAARDDDGVLDDDGALHDDAARDDDGVLDDDAAHDDDSVLDDDDNDAARDDRALDDGAFAREPEQPAPAARWLEPGALAAQEAQLARNGQLTGSGTDLSSAWRLRPGRRAPRSGWRRMLYLGSGRLINPGESPADVRQRELTARVNQPLYGCYKLAMLSLKGGVGKTTITATLGGTFASLRGDRVIAVDANPDRGTLSQKIPLETSATVRHLLRDSQRIRRYTDVRAYTSQGPSRLEVLASEQDPAVSEAFSEHDYRRAVNLLEHFYNIVLTDCGTGLMHSAMYGVLGLADSLIIVSSGSIDGARSASATMDWLDAHGHGELVANSVAVINSVRRSSGSVDLDRVAEHFAARCRAVVRVPFDSHLEEGAEMDLDQLAPATRAALLELAASVADGFGRTHAPQPRA